MEYCLSGVSYFYSSTIPICSVYSLFALFGDEAEVFLPEYSKPAILHSAHLWREVDLENTYIMSLTSDILLFIEFSYEV